MKISELVQGKCIYYVENFRVRWLRYVCLHPRSKHYHIVLDESEKPVRVYNTNLQQAIDQGLFSYEEAQAKLFSLHIGEVIELSYESNNPPLVLRRAIETLEKRLRDMEPVYGKMQIEFTRDWESSQGKIVP